MIKPEGTCWEPLFASLGSQNWNHESAHLLCASSYAAIMRQIALPQ